MTKHEIRRYGLAFAGLVFLLCILFVWNLNSGSVDLSVGEILGILLHKTGEGAAIVWDIRLPRILAAILLGGALLGGGSFVPGRQLLLAETDKILSRKRSPRRGGGVLPLAGRFRPVCPPSCDLSSYSPVRLVRLQVRVPSTALGRGSTIRAATDE